MWRPGVRPPANSARRHGCECQEEAGVSEDLLHGLKPVGAVSYTGFHQDRDWAVKPDTLFCFDLAVPNWEPGPWDGSAQIKIPDLLVVGAQVDGEVESFEKMTVDSDRPLSGTTTTSRTWAGGTDFLVRHARPADDCDLVGRCGTGLATTFRPTTTGRREGGRRRRSRLVSSSSRGDGGAA